MIDLTTLGVLALIMVVGALFWRGQAVRERALRATRQRCKQYEVVLLDQTVALAACRPRWSRRQGPQLERRFRFEFTVTGQDRYQGVTTTRGDRVASIFLEPHTVPEDEP